MNDQTRMRFIFFGSIAAIVLILIGLAIFITIHQRKSPLYTTKIVDRDTGEVMYVQPNQAPEGSAQSPVSLFGATQLFDAGATSGQFSLIKQSLDKYAVNNLVNKYKTLTFVPNYFKSNPGTITGKLRLGETDNLVDFTITLSQLKFVRVQITDSTNQNGGNFDSGQLTVPGSPAE